MISSALAPRPRLRSLYLSAAMATAASCRQPVAPELVAGPVADIRTLSSPALFGRRAGTPGADSAAALIMRRYAAMQLRPAFRIACVSGMACGDSYFQEFSFRKSVAKNVGGIIAGSDSALRTEYIVLGAHFDGQDWRHAFDPQRGFVMRPGADDNASGVAGILELARRFVSRPIRRSLVIVSFDAEEDSLCGSRAFVANLPVPRNAIALMLNLDMIGRMQGNRLVVGGVVEHSPLRPILKEAAAQGGLRLTYVRDRGLTDDASFRAVGVEAILLSTGGSRDYHTTKDVADRIEVRGLARSIDLAEAVVRRWDAQLAGSLARGAGRPHL